MKTRIQPAIAMVAMLCVLALGASPSGTRDETDYVIRVTSEVEGKQVKFDTAVLFVRPGAVLKTLAVETPFEMNGSGFGVSAMFVSQGDAMIRVHVIGQQGDNQVARSMATGRTVVAGENLIHDAPGFIASLGG